MVPVPFLPTSRTLLAGSAYKNCLPVHGHNYTGALPLLPYYDRCNINIIRCNWKKNSMKLFFSRFLLNFTLSKLDTLNLSLSKLVI